MPDNHTELSRRERQVMDILFAKGEATVNDIRAAMPDDQTATAVRTFLRILMDKGQVRRRRDGLAFVYRPAKSRVRAGRSALNRVLSTFFGGSIEEAVASHLSRPGARVSAEELDRLQALIDEARRREENGDDG